LQSPIEHDGDQGQLLNDLTETTDLTDRMTLIATPSPNCNPANANRDSALSPDEEPNPVNPFFP